MKLKINYHANWFEDYQPNTFPIPSPFDPGYELKPIVVRDQLPKFYDDTYSGTYAKKYRVKEPDGTTYSEQTRTPNTHISNWYDLLNGYGGILPDNFLHTFSSANTGGSFWYVTSNVYMRFPNNIHTVGDNFMTSYVEVDVVYGGAGGGTHEHDLYIDIIFPESLLYAGDNFMYMSFWGNYTTSYLKFNDQFSMPKNLRVVGDYAFYYTFQNLRIANNILPPSLNLPQKLYKVGNYFCYYTFNYSKITELSSPFNLPQNIIEYGTHAYYNMFYSSSITKLPLSFTIPSISSISNNKPKYIIYFMRGIFQNSKLETLPTNFCLPQIYFDLYGIYHDSYLSSTNNLFMYTFYGCTQLQSASSQLDSSYEEFHIPNYIPFGTANSERVDFQSFFPAAWFPTSILYQGTPPPGSSVWIKRNFS